MDIVPMSIRAHLIPFLFDEMDGTLASYDGQKVKMIRLYPTSSISNYLYLQLDYEKKRRNYANHDFVLYLSIQRKKLTTLSGTIYIDNKGVKEEMYLDIEKVRAINNLFEDIFRISMIFFIDGWRGSKENVTDGINAFIDKYSLLEYGFNPETLRVMYYREKKKKLLKRIQVRSSNQVLNFE